MNDGEIELAIRASVRVTRQHLIAAKANILSDFSSSVTSTHLIDKVLKLNAATICVPVVISAQTPPETAVKAVAAFVSWHVAASEAIWALIHSGYLFGEGQSTGVLPYIRWTRVGPGNSSYSQGWDFKSFSIPLPQTIMKSISLSDGDQFLAEPDLYLSRLHVADMHSEVERSFVEAVRCFRAELFTASLAMLGRASEGAWLELGEALLRIVPLHHVKKFEKQKDALESPMTGVLRKIDAVQTIYADQVIFASMSQASGIKPLDLKGVTVWSDAVRDSRNTIHFGVASAIPNTYEKVAALLIGAVPHIRLLYRLKGAADAVVV